MFEKTCVLTEICCFLLFFIFLDLVWCWWHIIKQIFHALFLFNIEIIPPNNLNNLIVPVGGRWICYSWPFFEKKEVVTEIYFALLEFTQDFVWCWGYIMKKYSMSIFVQYWNYSPLENNIQLRFVSLHINYLGWIIFDIKQKGME